ncbi:MAG TPA: thioredoxin family protein [Bacteroidetes bacterium]|nr:thioredoxin family protein [Bacteroidota bacterium]
MSNTPSTMPALNTSAPPFNLPDFNGKYHSSEQYKGEPLLVIFFCNHCPFVKHVISKLADIVEGYQGKGIHVAGINANDIEKYPEDSPKKMKEFAAQHHFTFPYLFDKTQEVAKLYRAACTPDFFLFNAGHKLIYRGQMDDSRPGNSIPVTGEDLNNAVENFLAGKPVSEDQKPSIGCNIKWKSGNEPDYFG